MARQLTISLVGDSKNLTKSLNEAQTKTQTFGDKIKGVAKKAGPPIAAVGVGLTALGGPLDQANARLDTAVKNSTSLSKTDIEGWSKKNQRAFQLSGVSIAEQNEALTAAINSGADYEQTTKAMAAANELSATKGISLGQAMDDVVKIMSGKGKKTLDEFGIGNLEGAAAVEALEGKLRGTSAALDKTFSGRLAAGKTIVMDYAASIGTKLGPALTGLGSTLTIMPGLLSGVKGAVGGVKAAMTALSLSPLMIGILAGGAIILALVMLEKKFGVVTKSVNFVKNALSGVFDWVMGNWKTLANVLTMPFLGAFRAIAWAWNNTVAKLSFKVPSWVPGIGGKGFSVPKMPTLMLHTGGMVPGHAGQDVMTMLQAGERVTPRGQNGGSGTTINLTVNALDSQGAAEAVVHALRAYERSNGPVRLALA